LTLAHGERAHPEMVIPVYLTQRYTLWDFPGEADEVQPAISDLVAERPARPVFRCVLAHVHARMGRLAEAQRALDDLTRDDCAALPFDQEWMFGMSLLAETAQLLDDADAADVLYPLLRPWSALNVVDPTEGVRGAAARYLGILATTSKRWDDATPHFETAIAMNAAMGARPWLALTQEDYARMLLVRGRPADRERPRVLLDDAAATYRELGMAGGLSVPGFGG
jgi:hypothetical protein